MNEQFTYLITLIVFAVSAVAIEWSIGFRKLKSHRKVVGIIILVCLMGTIFADNAAITWRIWVYHPERFLAIYVFGIPLETYLFAVFVSIAVASAALAWGDFEDRSIPLVGGTINEILSKLKRNSARL